MDSKGSSANSSVNNFNFMGTQNNLKENQEVSLSMSKKNSQQQLHDNVDIDKYMSLVEEELKKINYSLSQRTFIENIINILDRLIAVILSFNKFKTAKQV